MPKLMTIEDATKTLKMSIRAISDPFVREEATTALFDILTHVRDLQTVAREASALAREMTLDGVGQ